MKCKRSCNLDSCTQSCVEASAGPSCLPADTNERIELHVCYQIAALLRELLYHGPPTANIVAPSVCYV